MSSINIIPIGSGSTGNSIYFEIGPYHLLIDMGIGSKKVKAALSINNRNIEDIDAIFLTHGHYDHTKACKAIANATNCNVYANESSMYPIRDINANRIIIEEGQTEIFQDLFVTMFHVPHDYSFTSGYTFTYKNTKLAYVTDCGKMYDSIFNELLDSDVVIIESNHDIEMLKHGPYPKELQNRILSKYGHLSNIDCANTINELYKHGTKNFLLAHISLKNNTSELALNTTKTLLNTEDIYLYACPEEGNDLLEF